MLGILVKQMLSSSTIGDGRNLFISPLNQQLLRSIDPMCGRSYFK